MQQSLHFVTITASYYLTMSNASARTSFLLSQVGTAVSSQFALRVREIGLTPSEAGIIRLLGRQPGISQRELAARIGTPPSRMVGIIDALVERDFVARVRNSGDRRSYELTLTEPGTALLAQLRTIAAEAENAVLSPLSDAQRADLHRSLTAVAEGLGLDSDLHVATTPRA